VGIDHGMLVVEEPQQRGDSYREAQAENVE
jgi:hypothetical protein